MQLHYNVYTRSMSILREGQEEILLRHSGKKKNYYTEN